MTWWRHKSLRTRLLWLVLLTLAPAIILHVASALEKRRMALRTAEKNLKSITALAAANTQSILENASDVLFGLSKLEAIIALTPSGARQVLDQAKEIFPNFASLSLLRPDGSPQASTLASGDNVNSADLPWVRQALATKKLAMSALPPDNHGDLAGISLVQPVLRASGDVVGLCVLTLRLNWFSLLFENNRIPDAAEACLFDEHGGVLASWPHNPQKSGTPLPDGKSILAHADAASESTWTGPGLDGSPYYFVVATVMHESPHRLLLRLGLPARAVIGPLDAALHRDMLVLGLAVALALLAAHLFSRAFVLRPTQQLAQMAKAMAGGDLDRRSGMADGQGEMAELGQALDRMADNLRQRIRLTQEIIDAIPAPVFYKDLDGRYQGCNKAYEQNIHPLATILGKTAPEVEPPDQAERCVEIDRKALKNPGRTMEYETAVTFQDGSIHDMVFFKSVFDAASGRPAGIVGVGLDITARKQSERELLASETKYRALLASMRDGFVVVAPNNRIVESNPAFREMLGYTDAELARMTYFDITPEIWHEAEETLLRTAVDTHGFSDVFEKEYRRKDGSIFPVALRLHRYPSRAGDDCRYFAIVRDITDVKGIEADLRSAKEAAETANRAKSDFLAKMSHDIRTPLHAVIGMTELTLGTELSPQQRDSLETVRESAGSLLELINGVLDISRIEARKLEVTREDFDLRRTLAATIRTMRPQALRKELSLTLAISPRTPRFVKGDQVRLRQILVNLIGNALKFTEQGGVTVQVRPAPGESPPPGQTLLECSVADSGVGIQPDRLGRIFEMFTQADSTVSRQYGGTGLGLAICKELAKLMGGRIEARSTPDQGSVFCVTLPFATGQAPPSPKPAAAKPLPPTGAKSALRILLAEDIPINIKVATTYLARCGHEATVAHNGREALECLSRQKFDLVLMDLEMPEVDGLEATRRLRAGQAGPANRDIPVIAMTAHALSGSMERCLAAGMTAYLPKPLDFKNLSNILEQVFQNGGLRMATASTTQPEPTPELDTKAALSRLDDDVAFLFELQNDFLRQYPKKLRLIALCIENENWSEAALAAHSLKNIAGAIGAEHSRILAGHLEEHLRHAETMEVREALTALKESLALADSAIKTHRDTSD
ncbi:MAG: PAS domain S-box protein [Solidesulfovibrio sp.]